MKKVLIVPLLLLGLTACGSSKNLTPQAQKDVKQAQGIVQACLPKGNLLSHNGRLRILHCVAPPGHTAAFERCAVKYLTPTAFVHRSRLYQGVALCLEKNR